MKLKQLTATLMMLSLSPLALADFTIQDIRVEGLQRTEPSTVFSYLPVKVGDTFTDARGEEIIKNLYATGFFDDVRVETLGDQVLLTVVERPTASAGELARHEFTDAAAAFEQKIRRYATRFVAFLGKPGYSALSGQRQIAWGLQPPLLGGAAVWVLPNPSGRNLAFNLEQLVQAYQQLREAIAQDNHVPLIS